MEEANKVRNGNCLRVVGIMTGSIPIAIISLFLLFAIVMIIPTIVIVITASIKSLLYLL